jgi:tryptophan synthase alpha chain
MNRLQSRLERLSATGDTGLAPYVTAGDGSVDTTLGVVRALESAGAAVVELGVPFSDPIADGPVLQAAAGRALASGTTFDDVLGVVAALRRGGVGHSPSDLPVIIFSYANPLLRRGWDRACGLITDAGGDGLIVPDRPVEEGEAMRYAAREHGLCPIFFVTPTTSERRVRDAASASRGFLYVVGRLGVTGGVTSWDAEARRFLARIRDNTDLPLGVGFGLSSRADVAEVARFAELAIVGSALVDHIHRASGDGAGITAAAAAAMFMTQLAEGLPGKTADRRPVR